MENTLQLIGGFKPNVLDLISAAVFIACLLISMRKGLIRMVYNLVSLLLSFVITSRLYPFISITLRSRTGLYNLLMEKITEAFPVGDITNALHLGDMTELSGLSLPDNVLQKLLESNELHIYEALGVFSIEEYVAGFLANMVINVVSAALVFILTWVLLRVFGAALDIAAKLPVIRSFNKAGGAVAGVFIGFIAIWIVVNAYCIFYVSGPGDELVLRTSATGRFFYENGLVLKGFTHVFVK